MNKDLKKAIVNYMFDNDTEFQLINETVKKFRQYIYDETGEYCFGGKEASYFIDCVKKLIKDF